jgi:hypothetical protein
MANVRSRIRPRRRLPLRPFPCPRPVDRFATARRCPERMRNAAHLIPRSSCFWRDQREDLFVGPFVRVRIQEVHPLAWSIACGGLRVGRTRRGQHGPWQRAARRRARSCSSKAQRAAAAVRVVHGTWWRGCWGRASGGPAAEDISAPPKRKGRLARAIGSVASRAYLLRRQLGASNSRPALSRLQWGRLLRKTAQQGASRHAHTAWVQNAVLST